MATKQCDTFVQECALGDLLVWTDASKETLGAIPGIAKGFLHAGYSNMYTVRLDPRYDRDETIAEIKAL